MKGTFIVTKEKLTKEERLIYCLCSMNSDNKDRSNISRQKLSELSGIKTLDYISKWTGSLVKKGLIKKTYTYMEDGSKIVHYQMLKGEKWMKVNQSIRKYGLDPKSFSLFIGLACLRMPGSNKVKMEMSDVYEYVDFSRPSFKKYSKILVEKGLIEIGDEITINEDVVPVDKIQISKELKKEAELMMIVLPDGKRKNRLTWTMQHPDKIVNWKLFLLSISTGCDGPLFPKHHNDLSFEF